MRYKLTNRKKEVNGITVYKIKYEDGTWGGWLDKDSFVDDDSRIGQDVILVNSRAIGTTIAGNVKICDTEMINSFLSFSEHGKYNSVKKCEIYNSDIHSKILKIDKSSIHQTVIVQDSEYITSGFILNSWVFNSELINCRLNKSNIRYSFIDNMDISNSNINHSTFRGIKNNRFNFCMDSEISYSNIFCKKIINCNIIDMVDLESMFVMLKKPLINCAPLKIFDIYGFRKSLTDPKSLYIYDGKIYGQNKLRKVLEKIEDSYLLLKAQSTLRVALEKYGKITVKESTSTPIIDNRELRTYFSKIFDSLD